MPVKKKLEYFWEYYKWHVIIGGVLVVMVVSLIYSFATRKEYQANCMILNMLETDQLVQDLAEDYDAWVGQRDYMEITSNYPFLYSEEMGFNIPMNMAQMQLTVQIAAMTEPGFLIAGNSSFEWVCYQDLALPVEEVLPEELTAALEPYLVWYDGAEVTDPLGEETTWLPSGYYGLDLSETAYFADRAEEKPILCIGVWAENPAVAEQFVRFLYGL